MTPVQFGIQEYQAKSRPVSYQRCYNMYSEVHPEGSDGPVTVTNAPGKTLFTTCGVGPGRGALEMGGVAYFVSGTSLYKVTSTGVATSLGTIVGTARVSMATDGVNLVIVNGAQGYVYTVSGGLITIADTDFVASDQVVYQFGYFVFINTNSDTWIISELGSATSYNALDFDSADVYGDANIAVVSDHSQLFFLGKKTIEPWYLSNSTFPFERTSSPVIERGCSATHSAIKFDNSFVWLGDDRVVYRFNGEPERISNNGIETDIQAMSDVSDAFAYEESREGHKFYILTFPTGEKTYAYDASTGKWHNRGFYNNGAPTRDKANAYCFCYNKHLVIDYRNGKVYETSTDVYTDDGDILQRIVTCPPIDFDRPVVMAMLEVRFESGVGLVTGQGSDPQAMLRWSDDGNRTWSPEMWQSIGVSGSYEPRVRWWQLGQFNNARTLEITMTDPVKTVITKASAEIS